MFSENNNLGRTLIVLGTALIIIGLLVLLKNHIPILKNLGALPGDFTIKKVGLTFYFPFATCLVVSILINLIFRYTNK